MSYQRADFGALGTAGCVAPSAVAKQTTLRYGGQVGARGREGPGPRG